MPRRVAFRLLGAAELVTNAETKIHLILPRLHKILRIFWVASGTIWDVVLFERIERFDTRFLKVASVLSRYGQIVLKRCGGDHSI